jgi:Na+-transporting NADH:ubiquinone oxidoreductase subunit NqrD
MEFLLGITIGLILLGGSVFFILRVMIWAIETY